MHKRGTLESCTTQNIIFSIKLGRENKYVALLAVIIQHLLTSQGIETCEIALRVTEDVQIKATYWTQSQSHITTDSQSVRVGVEPHPGFMAVFRYCWSTTVLSMWGPLSKEITGLSFVAVIIGNMSHYMLST